MNLFSFPIETSIFSLRKSQFFLFLFRVLHAHTENTTFLLSSSTPTEFSLSAAHTLNHWHLAAIEYIFHSLLLLLLAPCFFFFSFFQSFVCQLFSGCSPILWPSLLLLYYRSTHVYYISQNIFYDWNQILWRQLQQRRDWLMQNTELDIGSEIQTE